MLDAFPLVVRELRSESRRNIHYGLRVVAGALAAAFFLSQIASSDTALPAAGEAIFWQLNTCLWVLILLIGPAISADSISSERREGTLRLLLMAPLTAREIVLAKLVGTGVRAAVMLVSVVPMISVCVLLGGVGWAQLLLAAFLHISVLVLVLGAGLCGSASSRSHAGAVIRASFYCLGALIAVLIVSVVFIPVLTVFQFAPWPYFVLLGLGTLAMGFLLMLMAEEMLRLELHQEQPDEVRSAWVADFEDSAFWQWVFRWRKHKTLDRNPVAWLQEYSWSARLTKWGWAMGILFFESFYLLFMASRAFQSFYTFQAMLCLVLGIAASFTAVGSFQNERESGALELLLVSPLRPGQIIWGRVWGVWCHFFPAAAIVAFFWFARTLSGDESRRIMAAATFVSLVTIPLIGLYISFLKWNFIFAWVATFIVSIGIPYFVGHFCNRGGATTGIPGEAIAMAVQIAVGWCAWTLIETKLKSRSFADGVLKSRLLGT